MNKKATSGLAIILIIGLLVAGWYFFIYQQSTTYEKTDGFGIDKIGKISEIASFDAHDVCGNKFMERHPTVGHFNCLIEMASFDSITFEPGEDTGEYHMECYCTYQD